MRYLQLLMVMFGAAAVAACAYVFDRLPPVEGIGLTALSVAVALMLAVSAGRVGKARR